MELINPTTQWQARGMSMIYHYVFLEQTLKIVCFHGTELEKCLSFLHEVYTYLFEWCI